VARGQPVQIAFAADSGFAGTPSLGHAIQMAVDDHGGVLGFAIRINAVNTPTCGSPPNTVSAATTAAYRITANLQNVAVLGQVCSHGFAQALAIYQKADIVVISGSATNTALPAAGPTVFNRTIVDDNNVDNWYPVISQLPGDLAWRLDYTVKFGAPPADFADLYYDAAAIVLDDIAGASRIDAKGDLVIDRAALARAVRTTSGYRGVTCSVTIDSGGDRVDDGAAINACAG
jgi:ABC-type branched-subunit amino acid transport system substrate-binding protein